MKEREVSSFGERGRTNDTKKREDGRERNKNWERDCFGFVRRISLSFRNEEEREEKGRETGVGVTEDGMGIFFVQKKERK